MFIDRQVRLRSSMKLFLMMGRRIGIAWPPRPTCLRQKRKRKLDTHSALDAPPVNTQALRISPSTPPPVPTNPVLMLTAVDGVMLPLYIPAPNLSRWITAVHRFPVLLLAKLNRYLTFSIHNSHINLFFLWFRL